MKIRIKDKNTSKIARLEKEEYSVLGYGEFALGRDRGTRKFPHLFLILDDDRRISTHTEALIEISDTNLSGFVRRDELNYSNSLYLDKNFNESIKDFNTPTNNFWYSIWNLEKNKELFKLAGYDISNYYYEHVCDRLYKVSLVQSLLSLLNEFMDPDSNVGHYHEEYLFYETKKLEETVHEKFRKDLTIVSLDENQYGKLLRSFIADGLRSKIENEDKYLDYENQLFYLINYITNGRTQSISRIKTHYDDCFVMEHENMFYTLNKSWWG